MATSATGGYVGAEVFRLAADATHSLDTKTIVSWLNSNPVCTGVVPCFHFSSTSHAGLQASDEIPWKAGSQTPQGWVTLSPLAS